MPILPSRQASLLKERLAAAALFTPEDLAEPDPPCLRTGKLCAYSGYGLRTSGYWLDAGRTIAVVHTYNYLTGREHAWLFAATDQTLAPVSVEGERFVEEIDALESMLCLTHREHNRGDR